MKADTRDRLDLWQQRCKAHGLALTVSRQAILSALLEQEHAQDAVPLLQAAQKHHVSTSIGTVYRFLRELELRGLVDAQVQPHERTRWQLQPSSLSHSAFSTTSDAAADLRSLLARTQECLRARTSADAFESSTKSASLTASMHERDRMLAVLRELARQLGYRLLPDPGHTA